MRSDDENSRYLAHVVAADLTIEPGRWRLAPAFRDARPLASKDAAWDWLEAERENLRAAVEAAHERHQDERVWSLCEALWPLYSRRGYYDDWVATHELAVDSAVRLGDQAAEALMRTRLGLALRDRDDEAIKQFTKARKAARSAGDLRGEIAATEALGLRRLRQERWDEALRALEENLRLAEETGDQRTILIARHHLGHAFCAADDLDRAIDVLQPLPDAFVALDEPSRFNRGCALISLGEVCLRRGLPEISINFFGQALEIMRAERAAVQEADVWAHFADAAHARRDPDAERAALTEAQAVYESLGGVPEAGPVAIRLRALCGPGD